MSSGKGSKINKEMQNLYNAITSWTSNTLVTKTTAERARTFSGQNTLYFRHTNNVHDNWTSYTWSHGVILPLLSPQVANGHTVRRIANNGGSIGLKNWVNEYASMSYILVTHASSHTAPHTTAWKNQRIKNEKLSLFLFMILIIITLIIKVCLHKPWPTVSN